MAATSTHEHYFKYLKMNKKYDIIYRCGCGKVKGQPLTNLKNWFITTRQKINNTLTQEKML